MDKNRDTIACAVSLIFRAAIVAAKYSGRVRKRGFKRLAAMDINEKDKENLFRKDKVYEHRTISVPRDKGHGLSAEGHCVGFVGGPAAAVTTEMVSRQINKPMEIALTLVSYIRIETINSAKLPHL